MFTYSDFIDRNIGVIDRTAQEKIKSSKIMLAGCGLGSLIAETAVRQGFANLVLIDGDKVELSNLNRQRFYYQQVGVSKVEALAHNLKEINPDINITVVNENIDKSNLKTIVDCADNCDFVVNTIDFNTTFFELTRLLTLRGKYVFLPLNVGFGGFLIIFNKFSKSIFSFFEESLPSNEEIFYLTLLKNLKGVQISDELRISISSLINVRADLGHDPQMQVAANISSSLVVSSMIKVLQGKPVKTCPSAYLIEPFSK